MAVELGSTTLNSDANLQAYYKLENVNDSKGSNNLTNNGVTPFNVAKFNNGADGGTGNATKYLNVANALGYTGGAYSISLWVKLTDETSANIYDFCELQDTGTDTSLLISYEYNGGTRRLNCGRLRSGVAFDGITYNVSLGTSVFHHIVLSYDGGTITLYFDDVNRGTVSSSGSGSSNLTSGLEILVGRAGASGHFTPGIIDDVGCFDRALTQGDVDLLYNGPQTGTFLKAGKLW